VGGAIRRSKGRAADGEDSSGKAPHNADPPANFGAAG